MKSIARAAGPHSAECCALSVHWMFSLVLRLGAHHRLLEDTHFAASEVAKELGLTQSDPLDEEDPFEGCLSRTNTSRDRSIFRALDKLEDEWQLLRQAYPSPPYPDRLADNLQALGDLIGLDCTDQKVLGFAVMLQTDDLLQETADLLEVISATRLPRMLSQILDLPLDALRLSLSRNGLLARSGLLTPFSEQFGYFRTLLNLSPPSLARELRYSNSVILEMFQDSFRIAPPGQLRQEDYDHIKLDVDILVGALTSAVQSRRPGVNVLVYGPPGTGKSELTRMVARKVGAPLYEIACTYRDGDPIDRHRRLSALRSATMLLANRPALLVFDEMEDLHGRGAAAEEDKTVFHKGWLNRMLEENPVPCFWVTNDVQALDGAVIRRFDVVLRLENPPRAKRERIIRGYSQGWLSEGLLKGLANHDRVTPAIVQRAMRVAKSCAGNESGSEPDGAVARLVDATLKAQGLSAAHDLSCPPLHDGYDYRLTNADHNLADLLEGLRDHPAARLCFFGPPGTGKTAAGHWLAERLGLPLMARRVSDIVSPYAGQTERNLANLFQQAKDERGVLLLDEVDSFLQDRKGAQRSWEVTQVNEMLIQMEAYPGLFVASTNLMEGLDEAALRRFDLKINFRFLESPQVFELFDRYAEELGFESSSEGLRACLRRLDCLTPGDFAAVFRRSKFSPIRSADDLYKALLAECSFKLQRKPRPIGFVA